MCLELFLWVECLKYFIFAVVLANKKNILKPVKILMTLVWFDNINIAK